MPEPITIPISTFELGISYKRPVLSLWLDRAIIVQKMFNVFERWNLSLDDVEGITTGKPSEQGVKFKLPLQKITFFFGPGGCKFTKESATWDGAEETLSILRQALDVLTGPGGVVLNKMSSSLTLHLQPKNVTFRELLYPFLPTTLAQLEESPAQAMAYVIRWKGRRVTLDGSAALANGIFLQLERDFEPPVALEEMKTAIYNDEVTMLNVLNVEEVAS